MIDIVAVFQGCFPEKFGVPRQAGIAANAKGIIKLVGEYQHENFIRGLDLYSHLWVIFKFHKNEWNHRPMVRPQRLGGNRRMGVFATRSSFGPNQLGLSALKIELVDYTKVEIHVSGHDLVNGTPIISIKPYIPFADSISDAMSLFVLDKPETYNVEFSEQIIGQLESLSKNYPNIKNLIVELISQDPTPKYHQDYNRIYGMKVYDIDILFKKTRQGFFVIDLVV